MHHHFSRGSSSSQSKRSYDHQNLHTRRGARRIQFWFFFFAQMISTSFCRWTRHESPLRFFSSRSDRSSYTHMGWRTNHAQLKAGGRIRYHHRLCETIQSASAPLRTKHSWDQPGILRVTTHSLRPDCSVLQQCSGTATQWSTIKYRNKQSYKVE